MQVISPGMGSRGRSGRGVRARQALSPLLHCGSPGLFIHPTAVKCTALFPLFPSSGLTRFSLPTGSLSMPIPSAHSSLNSFSSFLEHEAKPFFSDRAASNQLLIYTPAVLTLVVPSESLPTVLTSPVYLCLSNQTVSP